MEWVTTQIQVSSHAQSLVSHFFQYNVKIVKGTRDLIKASLNPILRV